MRSFRGGTTSSASCETPTGNSSGKSNRLRLGRPRAIWFADRARAVGAVHSGRHGGAVARSESSTDQEGAGGKEQGWGGSVSGAGGGRPPGRTGRRVAPRESLNE